MRVLLLHPDDDADKGPWVYARWDRVCDLGMASRIQYERWSDTLRCPIERVPILRSCDFAHVRHALNFGIGHLVDDHGLDWWNLLSFQISETIEQVIALRRFAETCNASDEIFVSRPALQSRILEGVFGNHVHCLLPPPAPFSRMGGTWRQLRKLRVDQVVEILGDKYDPTYRWRRLMVRGRTPTRQPMVLLPSAYGNATATAVAYARALPETRFLLVTTRKSGRIPSLPQNVSAAHLAGYAPASSVKDEFQRLLRCWRNMRDSLRENAELAILDDLGVLKSVPALLRNGLALRNAWLQVFETESIAAVLCTDEANPYTCMPLMLACRRGLPAVACHHGALDVRYAYRGTNADRVLAKSRMEADYLTRVCGLSEGQLEIAGPSHGVLSKLVPSRDKSAIVYFSEPYEAWGCRGQGVYEDVLPRLVEVARACDRELVIKLHPFESRRERERLALQALSGHQQTPFRIVDGPLTGELLGETWCALTVTSSAAVDCALCGIPVFLCTWLDSSSHLYAEQFMRFGAAWGLPGPQQLSEIPDRVAHFVPKHTDALWQTATAERLRALLAGKYKGSENLCDVEPRERAWA